MRILHVITRCVRGGAATIVLALARSLRERGHDLAIASGPSEHAEGGIESDVRAAGIPLHSLPRLVREARPWSDLCTLLDLHRLIRRERPDLLHTHTSKAGVLGRWAARAAGWRAIVHSPHGHVFSPRANIPGVTDRPGWRRIFYLIERASASLAARTIALTEGERSDLVRLRIAPAQRIETVPNGIPDEWLAEPIPNRTAARARVGLEAEAIWIGAVGRLTGEKGHDVILRAFGRLAPGRERLRLALVGDGPDRAALEALAAELGLSTQVRFLGSLASVREIYPALDALVLGSHYEAFGLVLLEAMARGCPVVATAVGGVPEVIDDGRTGLLVQPGDEAAMARALASVLDEPEAAQSRARAARADVARRFTLSRMTDRIESIYAAVLDRFGSRPPATSS